ncbi:hypothetical protein Y032_0367g35 [Ancylostoma ceylanicum]|uniref:Condensin-2 complex subunit H2 C-terminal domain-containing protein n=1 Tax=Ancylostoma ceylanicum TaxID=53326 RepID=A0A016RUU2_9BILA|nr:hypothetical protein Y032_0367g35 [Ancylostoma ceylanicum]
MAEDFEDAGQRYAFLLRPVKDLGKNFEINIAKELDDYCQQLKSAAENEEYDVDNQHRFNFAEAAMLIQGSAFVFGRKVDYVHSQAVHFFEALQPQKSKKKKKAGGGDDDEGFVDDNGDPLDPCDLLDYSNTKMCNVNSLYKDYSKSKYRGKPPKITVMPMSLMPLSDDEKNGVLIYSTGYRKEIVGKMDDFKMNAGFLNSRGVLLLQLVHEKIVDDFASEAFVRLWHPHLFPDSEEPKNPLAPKSEAPDSGRGTPTEDNGFSAGDAGRASSAMEIARRATSGTVNELQSARPSTQLLEVPDAGSQTEKMDVDSGGDACCYDDDFDTAASMHLPAPDDLPKRPSRMQQQQPQIRPWEKTDMDVEDDPTEKMLMDPFVDLKWKTKPVEKIKRFVKGTTVATRLQKMEKATMTFQKQTMQTNDYVREHFYMRKKHKTTKGDDWQSDALYRFIIAVMKKRAEAKRERKAKTKPTTEAVYDEDDGGNGDDDDDAEEENNENIPPKGSTIAEATLGTAQLKNSVGEATQAAPAEPLKFGDIEDEELQNSIDINSLYGGCQPTGESQPGGESHSHHTRKYSLLAILHEHMLKFWSTTEEVTSELVARVQEWEDTMMPILEEEETRKEFDIHEYGNELLNMFGEVGEVKTIDELMQGRRRYEISRYFLACLMMANTYNVKVEDEVLVGGCGRQMNSMKVTLLKRDRHHEVFDKAGAL